MRRLTHRYRWKSPKTWGGPGQNPLYGRRCAVLVSGRGPGPRNHLIQLDDGKRVVVARWAIRRDERRQMEMF
jgi:hypothetical protein